ncbi:MAG: fibronectin type III domain-containing protein [Bacteriovoracaceae bacterium]|nr:fibronectin type III domain-containing protein [Bacteriovoracaceae bacterium]
MKKTLLILLLFIATSCITRPDGATSESDILDVFAPINISDTAPVAGRDGNVSITFMGASSLEISFGLAIDDHTDDAALLYKVVHGRSKKSLSASSKALFDWQTFISGALTVNDLTASPYYFLLLVKDNLGQVASYSPFSNAPRLPAHTLVLGTATSEDRIELNWHAAGHSFLNPSVLQYQVYISTRNNISNLAAVRANGVLIQGWSSKRSSFEATGLDSGTAYFFNVVVKTPFGVELAYQSSESISTF